MLPKEFFAPDLNKANFSEPCCDKLLGGLLIGTLTTPYFPCELYLFDEWKLQNPCASSHLHNHVEDFLVSHRWRHPDPETCVSRDDFIKSIEGEEEQCCLFQ